MRRERALKIVLVLLGLLFCAAIYPLMLPTSAFTITAERRKSASRT